ncbi:hypothetical protein Q9233_009020 [Columba guinea]|nr:hypothetical protein Q9233_009020 [Columba guinea]
MAHLPVDINPRQPRRNSFEVSLVKEDGSTVELWSGIGKGPPPQTEVPPARGRGGSAEEQLGIEVAAR